MRSGRIRSHPPSGAPAGAGSDLTARARIRDAAIACIAARGARDATIRAIAGEAGVSPALVVHHFGSKEALRRACDEHVATTIRARKLAALTEGPALDPIAALRGSEDLTVLLRYLARTVGDGTPPVADLVDELVEDAVAYHEAAVASGLATPSDDPRGRAAVLVVWSLGALVLHDHLRRLTGADLFGSAETMLAYTVPALEVLSRGVLDETVYERVRSQLAATAEEVGP